MKSTQFSLIPFDSATAPPIEITGAIKRNRDRLQIQYQLTGKLSSIIIAPLNQTPSRQYDLWEATCLEFFLRPCNRTQYWEFNLAPSGDWNVFRFPDYRQDIAEELAYNSLEFEVSRSPDLFQLNLEVDLSPIIHLEQDFELAISAVVASQEKLSYWALTHPTTEADFHHPKSFVIYIL